MARVTSTRTALALAPQPRSWLSVGLTDGGLPRGKGNPTDAPGDIALPIPTVACPEKSSPR